MRQFDKGGIGIVVLAALTTLSACTKPLGRGEIHGAVIPAAMLLKNKTSVFIQALASLLILVGIFAMRYVIVVGGQLTS